MKPFNSNYKLIQPEYRESDLLKVARNVLDEAERQAFRKSATTALIILFAILFLWR